MRKTPKNDIMLEGPDLTDKDKVLIVEDVVTTGTQVMEAIKHVEYTGAKVVGVVTVVDRLAGPNETSMMKYKLDRLSIPYYSIFTINDLKGN